MSVSLVKGQKVSLTKEAPTLNNILVGLGWDAKKKLFDLGSDYDLDASAFLLRDGRLTHKDDIVYFGHRNKKGDAVYHHGDNLTGDGDGDDEQISVTLDKLPSSVDRVVFVVNIYQAKERHQSFKDVKNAFIRLVDESTGAELFHFSLSDGVVKGTTALIFAELYRKGNEWKFNAIGEGSTANSIQELTSYYN